MTKMFLLLYDFLNRYKKASLVSLILLFILFIVLASRVHYEEDIANSCLKVSKTIGFMIFTSAPHYRIG